jgi:LmbE family N-acetylglucosaminyl deacetylase
MNRTALAIAAHPDDIEFHMAGTLLQLRDRGWDIHCFNLSSGSLGSTVMTMEQTKRVRRTEAKEAARLMGAVWHPPVSHDLEILYGVTMIRKVASVIRKVNPSVVLTHPPVDYMEDHTETCRIAVTAAFAKGFPNYRTVPARQPAEGEVTVYHCMPHMLSDPMGRRVQPAAWVDVTSVMARKREALAAHRSQKQWLDETQGMDSYLKIMEGFGETLGRESGKFRFAEGWRKHLHAGFCAAEADPLREELGKAWRANPAWDA